MQAVLDGNPAWEHYNFLFQRANKLLKAAGERGYTDVLLEAERIAPNDPSNTQKAILLWCDEIMERRGYCQRSEPLRIFLFKPTMCRPYYGTTPPASGPQ
jgi:hypothetical protein